MGSYGAGMRNKEVKMALDFAKRMDLEIVKTYIQKKSKAKKALAMAKERAYDNLYARLETNEGDKELHRLTRQKDRTGKDVQYVRFLKDENGNVIVKSLFMLFW